MIIVLFQARLFLNDGFMMTPTPLYKDGVEMVWLLLQKPSYENEINRWEPGDVIFQDSF